MLSPNTVHERLRERGYRITAPRKKIIAALAAHGAISLAFLERAVKSVDLSTVYRTLHELEREGIVTIVRDGKDEKRYELADVHHDHLTCVSCGKVEHVPCVVSRAPKARRGWNIEGHDVRWYGRCSRCAA